MINNELEPEKIQSRTIIIASVILVCLVWLLITITKPFVISPQIPEDEVQYVQDEIIVQFKGETEPKLIKVPVGQVEAEVERYQQMDTVEYTEPNYIVRGMFVPNDPLYSSQWNLGNPDKGGIEMDPAWDISTGEGVIVAVVDTGIAYEAHTSANGTKYAQAPDLANTCFVPGYDFINQDEHPNDDHGHGTHVAGTIAQSTNNDIGVAGIAHNACLMPIKVLDKDNLGDCYNFAMGVRWAVDHDAQVINTSLGSKFPSKVLHDSVAYAYDHGVTLVASAGNQNSTVSYPAAYDDYVIAVGAITPDKTRAPYSNHGPSLDLVAPGGSKSDGIVQNTFKNIGSMKQDFEAFSYVPFSGTSMAASHVAGVAALLIANEDTLAPSQIRTILETTAEDLGAHGRDNYYGWGLINAKRALSYDPVVNITITPEKLEVHSESNPPDNTAIYNIQLTAKGEYSTMDIALSTIPELTNNMYISSSVFSSPDFGTGMPLSIHLEENDDTTYEMILTIVTESKEPLPTTKVINFPIKVIGTAEINDTESEQSLPIDIETTSSPTTLKMISSAENKFSITINDPKIVSVEGGETAMYKITATSVDDFEGVVNLSLLELTQYSVFNSYIDNINISENSIDFEGLAGQSKVVDMTIQTNKLPSHLDTLSLLLTVVGRSPSLPEEVWKDGGFLNITNPFYVGEDSQEEQQSNTVTWELPVREIDTCELLTAMCAFPHRATGTLPEMSMRYFPGGGWIDPLVFRTCKYNIPKVIQEIFNGFTLINVESDGPVIMSEKDKKIYDKLRDSEDVVNEIISNMRQQLKDIKNN